MNDHLRERILRKLETLSDEPGYQVLDYVEFIESRYAEREAPAIADRSGARLNRAVPLALRGRGDSRRQDRASTGCEVVPNLQNQSADVPGQWAGV